MDAVGSSRAALFGYSEGGAMCALFAATYPERTSALITMGSYARRTQADDYPFGPTQDDFLKSLEAIAANWGGPVGIETRMPSVAQDPSSRQWWSRFLRMSAGASEAVAVFKANAEIDIRHLLPSIRVPALILHAVQDRAIPVSMGRYMAQHLPNARLVELAQKIHGRNSVARC